MTHCTLVYFSIIFFTQYHSLSLSLSLPLSLFLSFSLFHYIYQLSPKIFTFFSSTFLSTTLSLSLSLFLSLSLHISVVSKNIHLFFFHLSFYYSLSLSLSLSLFHYIYQLSPYTFLFFRPPVFLLPTLSFTIYISCLPILSFFFFVHLSFYNPLSFSLSLSLSLSLSHIYTPNSLALYFVIFSKLSNFLALSFS